MNVCRGISSTTVSLSALIVALRGARAQQEAERRAAMADGNPRAAPVGAQARQEHEATLRECMEQLDEWGIQLKDPERGLIDFPHERDGVVVLLCFELSETELAFWHPIETGYAGRQPI